MLIEIPKKWRDSVAAILSRGQSRDILLRRRARLEWQALTLNPYDSSLFSALASVLRRPGLLMGHAKPDMDEPGETYEFAFDYHADHGVVKVYTKLNLTTGGKIVIIYSAHRPNKEDELTA